MKLSYAVFSGLAFAACLSNGNVPTGAFKPSAATAKVGQVIQLDGTTSVDKNKNGLTYDWRFVSVPAGSSPGFSDPHSPAPLFAPDVEGAFVIGLVVTDGAASNSISQTVTAAGSCFKIPATATVPQGEKATLVTVDSSCSAAQATFQWQILNAPAGSTATVTGNTLDPNFIPDQPPAYTLGYAVKYGYGGFQTTQPIAVTVTSCAPTLTATISTLSAGSGDIGPLLTVVPACSRQIRSVDWTFSSNSPGFEGDTLPELISNGFLSVVILPPSAPGNVLAGATVVDDHGLNSALTMTVPYIDNPAPDGENVQFAMNGSTPAVAYVDFDEQAVAYAELQSDGTWLRQFVSPLGKVAPAAPTAISLAYQGSTPCIAYVSGEAVPLLYLVCRESSGSWPGAGLITYSGVVTGAKPTPGSLTLLAGATKLHLLYSDATGTPTGGLEYLAACTACDTQTCSVATTCSAAVTIADCSVTACSSVGKMVLAGNGAPRIVFISAAAPASNQLLLSTCPTPESESCSPSTAGVPITTTGDAGASTGTDFTLAVSAADTGIVTHIAYHDSGNYARYRTCTGANNCALTAAADFVNNGRTASDLNLSLDATGSPTLLYINDDDVLEQATRASGPPWTISTLPTFEDASSSLQMVPATAGGWQGVANESGTWKYFAINPFP